MPKNNFKLFDENKSNMMTDVEYNTNAQRLNGVQSGVASSQLQNKTLYQTALMCYALAQIMAANGYDANDADAVSTFVNNLSSTMVQKVKDRASELEVKTGAKVNKYVTPGDFMTALNYLTKAKYGENDPTTSTEGTLGQIYVNTTTQRAFYCGKIEGNTFTWHPIARIRFSRKTEIITESMKWTVPGGVTSVSIFAVGGGGGGSVQTGLTVAAGGGGGGGHIVRSVVNVTPGDLIDIVIGAGGSAAVYTSSSSVKAGGAGGDTKFGENVIAAGAEAGSAGEKSVGGNGCSGGTGGGACGYSGENGGFSGGSGSYGGGGGAGGIRTGTPTTGKGGNGGTYGGGGGGYSGGGSGGAGCGSGGSNGVSATAGTNTIGMGLEFEGEGNAGSGLYGGGGGYGGNGGNSGTSSVPGQGGAHFGGGGGGGYGGNGGNVGGKYSCGGGGGGYGGNGGDGSNNTGGYGGGYGADNYGRGGHIGLDAKSGIMIISYEFGSIY